MEIVSPGSFPRAAEKRISKKSFDGTAERVDQRTDGATVVRTGGHPETLARSVEKVENLLEIVQLDATEGKREKGENFGCVELRKSQ